MTFPVTGGIQGMNALALFLNALHLSGGWHFGRGTRFDETAVTIDFDNPSDLAPAWRRYCAGRTQL
jgi:hypothetical protein